MTDHDALLNAIIADPDDDTARLVYADFIEEAGDTDRAAFVRQQVEVAQLPSWEPLAVHLKYFAPHILTGEPWRHTLPWANAWNPTHPFRRGIGYAIKVKYLHNLLEFGEQLFASAPIGELHLPGGDMDEYRNFVGQPWLPRVKSLHFWTLVTPMEPIRALCESRMPSNVESIFFEKASSPGMSFLVDDLLRSRIGPQLRELSFRVGNGPQLDSIEALEAGNPPRLERLRFDNMGMESEAIRRLSESTLLKRLKHLAIENSSFEEVDVTRLLRGCRAEIESLALRSIDYRNGDHNCLESLSSQRAFQNLRQLDLSKSVGFRRELPGIFGKSLRGLRSLRLAGVKIADELVGEIVQASFWPNLVELDLSDNQFTDQAARYLLAVDIPRELIALDLRGNPFGEGMRRELEQQFGERVLL